MSNLGINRVMNPGTGEPVKFYDVYVPYETAGKYLPLIVNLEQEHYKVHVGKAFKAFNEQLSLGTNTVKYSLDVHATEELHTVPKIEIYNGAGLVRLFEGATYTGGTPITFINRKRSSTNTLQSVMKAGVTSTDGTQIDAFFVGAGIREAGANRAESEWYLKSGVTYRIDVVGLVAGTQAIPEFDVYDDD